ncbi:MAG: MFS transporter, partial [Pseudomonadota bacterium]
FATIAAQVPFGAALDRFGPRPVLAFCMGLVGAGTALFAAQSGYDSALAARVMIGIGLAAMGAATHVIIAQAFPARDFGYVSGLVVTWGGIGGLLGTYPLAVALDRFAWGLVFGFAAVCAGLLTIAIAVLLPSSAAVANADARQTTDGYLTLMRDKTFRKILVMGIATYAPITAITGLWGGPYLQDVIGLTAATAGAVLLVLFAATIAAGWVFGVLDRRAGSRRAVILLSAGLSAVCLCALAALPQPSAPVAIGLLIIMVFSQQFYIPLGAHMRQAVPEATLGRAATLLSLTSVAAIPALQIGFGFAIDLAAHAGLGQAAQYRVGFAMIATLLIICAALYAPAAHGDRDTG